MTPDTDANSAHPAEICGHPEHDWETCPACVEQAKQDEMLGPDAEPFPRA